jgi:hypothetical protein
LPVPLGRAQAPDPLLEVVALLTAGWTEAKAVGAVPAIAAAPHWRWAFPQGIIHGGGDATRRQAPGDRLRSLQPYISNRSKNRHSAACMKGES